MPAGGTRRSGALVQDARASLLGGRRPDDGPLRRRRGDGASDQARAANPAARRRSDCRGVEGTRRLRAWLGLGSNVGDRLTNLRNAIARLQAHGIRTTAASGVYE